MPRSRVNGVRWAVASISIFSAGLVLWGIWRGTWSTSKPTPESPLPASIAPVDVDLEAVRPKVVAFCGACHAFSEPWNFPKRGWRHEIDRGFHFYFTAKNADRSLQIPYANEVYAFYERQAPDELNLGEIISEESEEVHFRREAIPLASPHEGAAISHFQWANVEWNGRRPTLMCCDLGSGDVYGDSGPIGALQPRNLAKFLNPSHIECTDLDGDGLIDFVVGDLGSPNTQDHSRGKVLWLRPKLDGSVESFVLAAEMGRVADVRPADFDLDGDLDLVVAEFGNLVTGSIRILWNEGLQDGVPRFKNQVIDSRHGAVCVPVADLNGDGHLDFLASISQEHEVVEAFLNNQKGAFTSQRVFTSGNPSFASTDIHPVDLDGDGDLDVLLSNGDTFDTPWAKPNQGVYWLENQGAYPFESHQLMTFPGAMRVRAGDLDGDNDLDIAAVGFLAPVVLERQPETTQADSIVWLEQTEPKVFQRHRVERGNLRHAALELMDVDNDGDLDVLVGGMNFSGVGSEPALTLWRNLRLDAGR